MSADLFAAFGASSQDQGGSQSNQNTNSDPFAFLASNNNTFQTQPQPQPPKPPQPQHQPAQVPIQWPSATPVQPQQSNVWGDLGSLGGLQGGLQSFQSSSPAPTPPKPAVPEVEDDDGWGDFEVAAPTTTTQPIQPTTNTFSPPSNAEPPRNHLVRSPTLDLVSNKLVNLDLSSTSPPPSDKSFQKKKPVIKPIRNADSNVLFDADDFELQDVDGEEDDDEFGDFEGTSSPAPVVPATSSGTQEPKKQPPGLFLSSGSSLTLHPEVPKSPCASSHSRKLSDVKELKIKTPVASNFPQEVKEREPSPITAWPSGTGDGFGDDWDEFKDFSISTTKTPAKTANGTKKLAKKPDLDSTSDSDWKDWGETEIEKPKSVGVASQTTVPDDKSPPPTNVPPPSILLSILPQLLDLSKTSILKMKSLPAAKQHAVFSDPATVTFLRGYLALATVTGRIIAGRKQRWQRDKFLLQGMSISAAGGMRGMKLATVDKTQSARDDHSAVAVLDVWNQQEGSLRSTVTAANAASDTKLRVPQLKLALPVHAAKNVPTAPKPCVICGLKRDERVTGVDFDVEDSFGEWWIDFWGHRACKNFWVEHEAKLRQR